MVPITIVNGVYKPSYNWGPHIVAIPHHEFTISHGRGKIDAIPEAVTDGVEGFLVPPGAFDGFRRHLVPPGEDREP